MKNKILLFLFLFIIVGCSNVYAKEIENTCVYKGNYTIEQEKIDYVITCDLYDNVSYQCKVDLSSSKQVIENWNHVIGDMDYSSSTTAKKFYKENRQCFPYMIFVDKVKGIDQYTLYAADSSSRAEMIMNALYYEWHTSKAALDGTNVSETDELEVQITKFNDLETYYLNLSHCNKIGGTYTPNAAVGILQCQNALYDVYDDINLWDKKVDDMVASGTLKESDDIVVRYRESVSNARSKFTKEIDDSLYNKVIDIDSDQPTDVESGNADCNSIFGGKFGKLLKQVLGIIRFFVPVLILALSVVDFIKVAALQSTDEMKKVIQKLIKRLIIGVIIFLLPTVIEIVLDMAGIAYGTCDIR